MKDNVDEQMRIWYEEALKEHVTLIDDTLNEYQSAITKANKAFNHVANGITTYDNRLKKELDKRIKTYNSSIRELFLLNSRERKLYYAGIVGGIATPVMLFLIMLAYAVSWVLSRFA